MSLSVALPAEIKETKDSILTFVVPAPNGCNLRCPFCYIRQRKELAEEAVLSPEDYVKFIDQINARTAVAAICVQGYEPLLPESFEYTRQILTKAMQERIASSLITNATFLAERVSELEDLNPYRVFVSLDGDEAEFHDRQRGVRGAFDRTIKGLSRAAASSTLRESLAVTSVLVPKKTHELFGVPELLKHLGVRRWIVNPLITVGKNYVGGPKADKLEIFREALALKQRADKQGVQLIVDDEFARLGTEDREDGVIDFDFRRFLKIQRLHNPGGVFRLLPTGQCSVGFELLQEVQPDTAVWMPNKTNAFDFIEVLLAR